MTKVIKEMKNAVIGIAGLGGLGSNVAAALARLGVGKLIMVDFDIVEESNLTRQQYFIDQIGMPKTEASLVNLTRINENIYIETQKIKLDPGNISQVFSKVDIVAECLDCADQKQMLVETVLTKMEKVIVVSVSGLAGVGKSNAIITKRISGRHVLVGDGESDAILGTLLTASRVGVAAYHQANAIAEIITNGMNVPDFGS